MVFSILSVKIMNMNMKPDIIKYTKIVLMMILIIGPIGYQTYILQIIVLTLKKLKNIYRLILEKVFKKFQIISIVNFQ